MSLYNQINVQQGQVLLLLLLWIYRVYFGAGAMACFSRILSVFFLCVVFHHYTEIVKL